MYLPKHFTNEDEAQAFRLIHENPFATLIAIANGEPLKRN
jgi:predicted FMN-binding regulatory protein PaiB